MRKLIALLFLITTITIGHSQTASFGFKGGLNFKSSDDLITFTSDADLDFTGDNNLESDNRIGYHVGVFSKFEFLGIFVQPEIVYTRLDTDLEDIDYTLSKVDVPLMAGLNFLGPLNLKAGPSLQYIINGDFEGDDIIENDFTVGFQAGLGIQLGRLGLDARYESSFEENDPIMIANSIENNTGFAIDSRLPQWIISISYILSSSDD